LVLLDEPFTGLDDRAVSIVTERLRDIAAAGRDCAPRDPRFSIWLTDWSPASSWFGMDG